MVLDMTEVNGRAKETSESVAVDVYEADVCRVNLEPNEAAVLIEPMTQGEWT